MTTHKSPLLGGPKQEVTPGWVNANVTAMSHLSPEERAERLRTFEERNADVMTEAAREELRKRQEEIDMLCQLRKVRVVSIIQITGDKDGRTVETEVPAEDLEEVWQQIVDDLPRAVNTQA